MKAWGPTWLLWLFVGLVVTPPGSTGTEKASEGGQRVDVAAIRHLVRISGTATMARQSLELAIDQLKKRQVGVPSEDLDRLQRDFSVEEAMERLIPLYQKYLTRQDVKAIVAFYESPAGRRLVETQPQIAREAGPVIQKYLQEVLVRGAGKGIGTAPRQ